MHIVVDSLLTNYQITGSGSRTILLLHGWADTSKTFDSLIRQLDKQLGDTTFITVDLPGFGGTQPPQKPWGLIEYATFIQTFLKKINRQPSVIIGHSNGGAIALHALANNELTADHLVLLASAGVRQDSTKKRVLRTAAKPAKIALALTPKTTQKRIKSKLYNAIGSDYLIAEHMQETFKKVVAHDVRQEARNIGTPTLLIYGQTDTATPPSYGELLASIIPNAELIVLPESGHFIHQERVYEVTDAIEDFIS